MTNLQATVGIVHNFGPLTMDKFVAITGWDKHLASVRVDRALRMGHLGYVNRLGRREIILARPVCLAGYVG